MILPNVSTAGSSTLVPVTTIADRTQLGNGNREVPPLQPDAAEPYKIKTVRPLAFPTLQERKKNLANARFNVFHLTPSQVTFDMTGNSFSAVSQEQFAGNFVGDESYAGSRNFENLQSVVRDTLGHRYTCPTHNMLGSIKLLVSALIPNKSPTMNILSNGRDCIDTYSSYHIQVVEIRQLTEPVFTGNVDLNILEGILKKNQDKKLIAWISLECFAEGQHPISLKNLELVKILADKYDTRLVLDASRIVENAWYIQKYETGHSDRSISHIVKGMAKMSHILHMDGAQDPRATTGGFISTDNPLDHEKFRNAVVVYEGLHTYGGMSGRTLEVLARGLHEMCYREDVVKWMMQQVERFTSRLQENDVPLVRGCDGVYIKVNDIFPSDMYPENTKQDTFSAALYYVSGIRAVDLHRQSNSGKVPVKIPRLTMMNEQLDQVADAISYLFSRVTSDEIKISPMHVIDEGRWRDQMAYHWVFPDIVPYEFDTFPYQVHTIEYVGSLERAEREQAILKAGYNTFLLSSSDVSIDLLTDSGTSAMSTSQWASYVGARVSSANSDEYHDFLHACQDTFGYVYCIPTHQGRAAEQILSEMMIKPGQVVPGNMYFTTTKLHQEMAGGTFVDVIVDEAHKPTSTFPWKGNIDMKKLSDCVDKYGSHNVSYISFEHSVNMAGGQPVSMDNMKEVYGYCSERGIPVFFDATRCVENAYMIQQRDKRYHNVPIADILREMMIYGDGCTVSGKKDFLINIGGLLAIRDNVEWAKKSEELLRAYEGSITDGGLATGDLGAIARGVREMVDDRYIRSRVQQTALLGKLLLDAGVPIVTPPGSHAIFLDAKRFLPHIPQEEFTAQRLAAAIYVETGVRAMERGVVSSGRNPVTGENYHPSLELVRLTIPRRVYTNSHIHKIAAGIIKVYENRTELRGLRMVYEPKHLRFFQSKFETL